ncbi:Uma2 family endonuclease [Streptomyces sp. Cmuel-A718b]|uniref:Uma2 family endonuclease n=1 Tax=Streptomyces TaxID=1883 RepID=UPI00081E3FE9|nr:Uma2 family endonuclease [Streptomyces sp. Cmuel-A718b]NED02891.1 Uma2 family endonuclease [Streptomyces sp. SID6648]SCF67777.1 Endonuclease, Uma2 family (restriction endonuclease fold) [Streptomyces sp. Cmuel-A718b]
MTVVDTDRIDMADTSDERTLDEMFEWLEPTPEGYKVEIVEGAVYMSPQRDTHWRIILGIVRQLLPRYEENRLLSDVRIDLPGHLNGFASDVVALSPDAVKGEDGRWRYQDIEFVAEVISKATAANDYGIKKAVYATAGVPVYLIVDPYTGTWHLHTLPKEDEYRSVLSLDFGTPVDLTSTVVGLTLATDAFPRD